MAPFSPVLLLPLLLSKTCAETFSVSSEDGLVDALAKGEIFPLWLDWLAVVACSKEIFPIISCPQSGVQRGSSAGLQPGVDYFPRHDLIALAVLNETWSTRTCTSQLGGLRHRNTPPTPLHPPFLTHSLLPACLPSLSSLLSQAGAGDVISLADGVYSQAIVTVQGGEDGDPLTIIGGRDAVINGGNDGRCVEGMLGIGGVCGPTDQHFMT